MTLTVPAQRAPEQGAAAATTRSVAVIDDHRTFADLLSSAVTSFGRLVSAGAAYDVDGGLRLVQERHPDVVVIDLNFGRGQCDGLDATALLLAEQPSLAVVLLSGHIEPDVVRRAALAGAAAVMPKDGALEDLVAVLGTVRPGVLSVHPSLLVPPPASPPRVEERLSRREREVLGCLMVGLDARSTARQLGISLHTCRGHVKVILRKLDAHSQLEAVAIARRGGVSWASVEPVAAR